MISKQIPMRDARKSSYADLAKYICDSQGKQERVGDIRFTNFNNESLDWAIREALAVQQLNQRAEADKTYHLLISFAPDEQPAPEVLRDIEDRMCAAIGYGEHQRVSAVHHDTDNLHIHIAINKIHPTKHTIHEPYRDYKVRSSMCALLEKEHGLVRTNQKARKRQGENRADDMESHSGVESLLGWVKRECSVALSSAQSWDAVHEIMRSHSLVMKTQGNGLVIVDEHGVGIKASSVARSLSKPSLEKRLGAFVDDAKTKASGLGKQHTGRGGDSLLAWVKAECEAQITQATTWGAFHRVMFDHGLRADTFKHEIRIRDGRNNVISSRDISSDCDPRALQRRLGAFERDQIRHDEARKRYEARPIEAGAAGRPGAIDTTELYALYKAEQAIGAHTRSNAWGDAKKRKADAIEAAKRAGRLRRSIIKLMNGPGVNKKLLYSLAAKSLKADIEKANAAYFAERSSAHSTHARGTWADWLQARAKAGDELALHALRVRRASVRRQGNLVVGKGPIKRKGSMPIKADGVTKDGTIIHRLAGAAIRDDGNALQVSRGSGRLGLEAVLRMAMHRYGSHLSINGSSIFKERIAHAAAAAKLNVTFDDADLESRRQRLVRFLDQERSNERNERTANGGRPGTGGRAGASGSNERRGSTGAGVQRGPGRTNQSRLGELERRARAAVSGERLRGLHELGLAGIRGSGQVLLQGAVHLRDKHQGADNASGLRRPVSESGRVGSKNRRGPGATNRTNTKPGKPPQIQRTPTDPVSEIPARVAPTAVATAVQRDDRKARGPGVTNRLRGGPVGAKPPALRNAASLSLPSLTTRELPAPGERQPVQSKPGSAVPSGRPRPKKPGVIPVGGRPPEMLRRRVRTLSAIPVLKSTQPVKPVAPVPPKVFEKPSLTAPTKAVDRWEGSSKAADKYIAERSSKQAKGFDIPNHRRYNPEDKGSVLFAGLRQIDDETLALLKRGEEVIVLPVDAATAQRLKRFALGDQVALSDKGAIRRKGRSR